MGGACTVDDQGIADALERQAGTAIRAMLTDGLTLAEVVTWTYGETTLKEATRLADLTTEECRS